MHGGTYGPVTLVNLWPSDQVLITNAPGENPVFEGWSSVADYGPSSASGRSSNIAIQGLDHPEHRRRDAEHGGYGIRMSESSTVKLYFNTVHDTPGTGSSPTGTRWRWWATRSTTR